MAFSDVVTELTFFGQRGDLSDARKKAYVNDACKWLDQRVLTSKSPAWYKKDVTSGAYRLDVQDVRAFVEVWCVDGDGRNQLELKSDFWIKDRYYEPVADLAQGRPSYYCPIEIGLAPSQSALTAVGGASPYTAQFTYGSDMLMFGSHWNYNGLLWMPPADGTYTMEVLALFWPKTLVENTDVNFWTERDSRLLCLVAAYLAECDLGNRSGQADRLAAVEERLLGYWRDEMYRMSAGDSEMAG